MSVVKRKVSELHRKIQNAAFCLRTQSFSLQNGVLWYSTVVHIMPIVYNKLWSLLATRNLKKSDLRTVAGLSSSTVAKLSQNKVVQTDVLERVCSVLNCNLCDIVEMVHEQGTFNLSLDAKREKNAKYSVVSLFSGCGGLDLGFRGGFECLGRKYAENPFEIIWANEINPYACETYAANVHKQITEGDIVQCFDKLPPYADVVIGGFPCQDISINGKMAGVVDGKRSGLYVWMVKTVKTLRPKVFIAENVKSLLLSRHASSLKKVIEDFSSIGYNVSFQLFDAADYGVPQNRERVIIAGVRKDLNAAFVSPAPVTRDKRISASEALSDLEALDEDPSFNHIWSRAKPSSGQGLRYLTADEPATTMRSECHGNIQFHYRLPRRISMREAARLQSFPDNFKFICGIRQMERMIGNAVPPVFSWHIAQAVLSTLRKADGCLPLQPMDSV